MPIVIELRSLRSVSDWADLDLRRLAARDRTVVIASALLVLIAAGMGAWTVYRHFGAPANEYDLTIYYKALTWWHAGNDLYSYWQWDPVNGALGFTYPPAAAVAMSPMTALSKGTLVLLSTTAIFAATIGLVVLSLRERVRLRRPQLVLATGLATAFAFCLQPISQNAAYGQVNTYLGLLVLFDILVLRRRGSRWAGVGIGLAAAVKLTPGIFLLYLVLSREWRMLKVAIATAASVTVLGAVCAPTASWEYFTSLLWDSGRVGVLDNTANQSINGTLARISAALPPDKIAWLACSLIVLAVGSVRIRRAVLAGDTLLAVTITGLLGVLISPVSWIHHAVWIVPAMVVLFARLVSTFPVDPFFLLVGREVGPTPLDPVQRRAVRRWAGTALLAITGLFAFVLNTRNLFDLPDTGYTHLGIGSVLAGSVQTLWMLTAVALLPFRSLAAPATTTHLAATRTERDRVSS